MLNFSSFEELDGEFGWEVEDAWSSVAVVEEVMILEDVVREIMLKI